MSEENAQTLITRAAERAAASIAEQLEYEVLGAWRAGYDWLHIYEPVGGVARQPLNRQFSITRKVLPSYTCPAKAPDPDGVRHIRSYDLRGMSAAEIRETCNGTRIRGLRDYRE